MALKMEKTFSNESQLMIANNIDSFKEVAGHNTTTLFFWRTFCPFNVHYIQKLENWVTNFSSLDYIENIWCEISNSVAYWATSMAFIFEQLGKRVLPFVVKVCFD